MIIKRFILTVACKDENNVDAKAVEDCINHGILDSSAFSATLADERAVDYPDPDVPEIENKKAWHQAMSRAEEAWIRRAEDEVYG